MPEIWQQALSKWDKWNESISDARGAVESQPGDIAQLLARAKTTWLEDITDPIEIILNIKRNREDEILWNLYDEVEEIGGKFISDEVGLRTSSELHRIFLAFWLHSVLPELTEDYDPDYYLQEDIAEYSAKKEQTYFRHFSRPAKWLGHDETIDSIYWYRGKVNTREVIERLQKIKWPSSHQVRMKAKGGRPSEEHIILPEAVVCALLKDRQRMTYRKITEIFLWSAPKSEWSSPGSKLKNGKRISQTAVNRVRLGREILHDNK